MKKYKLGELINVTRGASLSGEYFADEGDLVRLTMGNFDYKNNVFKENTSKEDVFYSGEVDDSFVLEKGDIITPLTEQAIGLLGSTARIPESSKYIQSQDVGLVKCISDEIDDSYLYYLLASPMVKKQLSNGAQQTKIRHTSPDKIKDCSVYIPDVESQQKMGKLLEKLDRKIALNRKINAELEQMAKGLYDYWFVQFDFPNSEGKPYKSSGGKMVYNEQLKREIPEGWEVKEISQLSNNSADSILPSDYPNEVFKHASIPAYDKTGDYTEEYGCNILSNKYQVEESHILVSKLNPWENRVVWGRGLDNLIASTEYIMWKLIDIREKGFLYYVAQSNQFIEYCSRGATGTSKSHRRINPNLMMMFAIPYNKSVVRTFSETVQTMIELKYSNLSQIHRLAPLRDQLLPLLMNGQVKIKD